jgi:hypothetical protein|tara:strand:+ start:736 stop:978 length:243 start_codon:yes stop_codon:yes gene_type:complete
LYIIGPRFLHRGHGVNYIVIGKKDMATEKKDRRWDGKSRPSTDLYKKEFNRIFGTKINRGSDEDIDKENEEYLEEIKDKL